MTSIATLLLSFPLAHIPFSYTHPHISLPPSHPSSSHPPTVFHTHSLMTPPSPPPPPLLLQQAGDPTVSYRLLYGCNKAGAAEEVLLDPATNVRTVTHLLPQCEYWLVVGWTIGQSVVLSEECNVTTPNGQSEQFPPSLLFLSLSSPSSLFTLLPSLFPPPLLFSSPSPSPPPSSVSPKG